MSTRISVFFFPPGKNGALTRRGAAAEQVSTAEVDKLNSRIGPLVAVHDFLADASHLLLGARGKKW